MTGFALALMLTSMGLVSALEIYCLWRLLSPRKTSDETETTSESTEDLS